jgi:hypothetical protein
MAQQTINNGETGLNVRTKLNSNFTEVYTAGSTSLTRMNNHVGGTAERHNASDVVNNSAVTGARVNNALDTLKGTIDSAVLAAANANIGVFSVSATGTNTLTTTITDLPSYFGGLKINLTIANNNTGAVTLNVNALGAKNLRKLDGTGTKVALEPRDLLAGKVAQLEYNGTDFILINAKDVATYSAEQTETVEVASLPNTAVEGEVDAVVKGATIVNLTGTFSGCESTSGWTTDNSSIATDSTNAFEGTNCLKITINSTNGYIKRNFLPRLDKTKHYLFTAFLKNGNLSGSGIRLTVNAFEDFGAKHTNYITSTVYTRVGVVLQPTDFDTASTVIFQIQGTGTSTEFGFFDAIQINEITQTEYTAGVTQALLDKYPYVNDIKHVEANRVKVVGKNLFDGEYKIGFLDTDGSIISTGNVASIKYIPVKKGVSYTIKNHDFTVNQHVRRVAFYDRGKSTGVLIYDTANGGGTRTVTAPENGYIRFSVTNNTDIFTKCSVVEGSVGLSEHEPYTETTRYVDKSLKSLPNGTKDTIDNNGLYTKRLSDLQDITGTTYASIDTATYTDVDVVKTTAFSAMRATTTGADGFTRVLNKDGVELSEVAQADIDLTASVGKYYVHTDKTIWFIVADGTYADVDGARTGLGTSKAMFELATPLTEQLALQPLQSQASGTIYNEPITRELLTYDTGLTLTNDLRKANKNFIESLYKVDGETKTPIALSAVTVASATSLTISGASDDEQYEIVYEVELGNSTRAELTYSYPLDNVAQLDDVSKITFKTNKELRDFINYQNAVNVVFDARITAVEP